MARLPFEDKLSSFLEIAEKASHGYYIANGVFHQNIDTVNTNDFIVAVRTIQQMFETAEKNKGALIQDTESATAKISFWNDLERAKNRFENIGKSQLAYTSIKNNLDEIAFEVKSNNPQVREQLKKAVENNYSSLPILYYKCRKNDKDADRFLPLVAQLTSIYESYNDPAEDVHYDLEVPIADKKEILSWFTDKDLLLQREKDKKLVSLKIEQSDAADAKANAITDANNQIEQAKAVADKAKADALKLMEEMQKKYGL